MIYYKKHFFSFSGNIYCRVYIIIRFFVFVNRIVGYFLFQEVCMDYQNDLILERILETLKNKGITEKELLTALKINTSFLTDWKKGRLKSPSVDKIILIANYLNLSLDWLASGKYSASYNLEELKILSDYKMISAENKEAVQTLLDLFVKQASKSEIIKEETRDVEYYLNAVSAGTGQLLFDDSAADTLSIPDIIEYKKVDYAVRVSGSSMEPKFSNNDILLVQSSSSVGLGEIGIFCVDDEVFVKKLGKNELISLNPEFDNIPLNENSRCLGRVIDSLRPNFFKS